MICNKCSAVNDTSDRFCYRCGAPLSDAGTRSQSGTYDPDGYPVNGSENNGPKDKDDLGLSIESNAALAIREAKRVDISNMRPITRVAYQIESSENASTVNLFLSIFFFGICIGLVVCLIALFQELQLFMQTYGGSATQEYGAQTLSDLYKTANTTNLQTLGWLVAGFIALLIAFVVVGKIVARTKKVRRKKRNREMDEY